MAITKAGDLIERCGKLKGKWSVRNQKIKNWYDLLTLKDEFQQEGMESVVANDPRTGYNLGKHLMIASIVAHKISTEELDATQIQSTSYLERYFTNRWKHEEARYRRASRQGLKDKIIGLMLATGWYSIFAMAEPDRLYAEVWNPFDVYPEFGNEGLIEVAHIYPCSPAQANRKVKLMGWTVQRPYTHNVNLYDYWGFDDDGDIVNGIVLGQDFVKEMEKDIPLSKLVQRYGEAILPVFMSPVGGLPDEGSIVGGKDYQKHFGEAVVATNEDLAKNYNKMLSFIQQLARTAAQPKYWEKTSGEGQILTPELLNTWGPIFRMGPNDDVGIMQPPVIPVELRTVMFEYSNMLQRGLFPAILHGNIQQTISYLAMANVASSALQVLTPYMEAFKGGLSDIDNFWFRMLKENNYNPQGFKLPENLPEEFEFEVQADIEIPGYLIQRATVARMLDPNFRLPTTFVMDKLFPEIPDPLKAMAQSRRDDAMMHPKAIMADQIIAYREHARLLRDAQQVDAAALYEKLATSLEAELSLPEQPQAGTKVAGPAEEAIMREAFPAREATRPLEGLGEV